MGTEMDSVFFFPVLTAVFYYLSARATITEPLWRRYPPALDRFLSCAACSGFWYGLGLGIADVLERQLAQAVLNGTG